MPKRSTEMKMAKSWGITKVVSQDGTNEKDFTVELSSERALAAKALLHEAGEVLTGCGTASAACTRRTE